MALTAGPDTVVTQERGENGRRGTCPRPSDRAPMAGDRSHLSDSRAGLRAWRLGRPKRRTGERGREEKRPAGLGEKVGLGRGKRKGRWVSAQGEKKEVFELIQNRNSNQIQLEPQNHSENYRKIQINQFGHEEFK